MSWARLFSGLFLLPALLPAAALGQGDTPYQIPPQAIVDIADAPPTPRAYLSPAKTWLLVAEESAMLSIGELARQELRLAGLRFHPASNAASRRRLANRLALTRIADGSRRPVTALPENPGIDHVSFSPDGAHVAFSQVQRSP